MAYPAHRPGHHAYRVSSAASDAGQPIYSSSSSSSSAHFSDSHAPDTYRPPVSAPWSSHSFSTAPSNGGYSSSHQQRPSSSSDYPTRQSSPSARHPSSSNHHHSTSASGHASYQPAGDVFSEPVRYTSSQPAHFDPPPPPPPAPKTAPLVDSRETSRLPYHDSALLLDAVVELQRLYHVLDRDLQMFDKEYAKGYVHTTTEIRQYHCDKARHNELNRAIVELQTVLQYS